MRKVYQTALLLLTLLLVTPSAYAVERSASWVNTITPPTLRVNDINHDIIIWAPEGLVIPDGAVITSVRYTAEFSWTSPFVQMLVGTGDTTGILPKGVLFGISETLFDGDTPENFVFRFRVEQDGEIVPAEDDILLHPMYGIKITVIMEYSWDDGEPEEPEPPTPQQRAIIPIVNFLLGDKIE